MKGKKDEEDAKKVFDDIKLGRKRDFVYGTYNLKTVAEYQHYYVEKEIIKDSPEGIVEREVIINYGDPFMKLAEEKAKNYVILRWKQDKEIYYKDLQDSDAIKTLDSIDIKRIEMERLPYLGDDLSYINEIIKNSFSTKKK